ncbi:reverse transcriptase family protein [Erythrobacter sp. KY5]|uniref:reverse transcriptase family protein n=1 Tax=Erythrobacter sp. KY5 TaxID=2011159 RepID=UPI0013A68FD4|nr:reverse transcriptase family protein [Erythrobacter sp. KY5]
MVAYLSLTEAELKKIRWFRRGMYHYFELAKGNGKRRRIMAPDARLKHLQRALLPLMENLYRVRNPVHGFVRDKSVKTNAAAHLRRRNLLNIDLKDFFGAITENRVVGVLEAIGVPGDVAAAIGYLCCCEGSLPQGAPSSPLLSNMVCFRLDRELMRYAKEHRCIYTRYADDITLSSHQPMASAFDGPIPPAGTVQSELLDPELRGIIGSNGFELNPDKIHYADRNSRRMVTGLKVNELLNVDRRFVRNLRAMLHSIEIKGHADAKARFASLGHSGSMSAHIRGKIEWLASIKGTSDPVVRGIILRYNACFPGKAIAVSPTDEERQDRATWITENKNGQGSLFFLKGVGLVTAAHCVADLLNLEIFHPSKHANRFGATVTKYDKDRRRLRLGLKRVLDPIEAEMCACLTAPLFGTGPRIL